MKRTMLCGLALASLAAGASMNASADTRAYAVDEYGRPVYTQRYERHQDRDNYAFEGRDHDRNLRRCDVAKWDPNRRYMPGEAVRRKGELYVATEVSRHVYNQNSPPEWTPNYWAPTRCR